MQNKDVQEQILLVQQGSKRHHNGELVEGKRPSVAAKIILAKQKKTRNARLTPYIDH